MSDDAAPPRRPPLWSGRPTTSSGMGGCSRCEDVKRLLRSSTDEPLPPLCSDCHGGESTTSPRTPNPNPLSRT